MRCKIIGLLSVAICIGFFACTLSVEAKENVGIIYTDNMYMEEFATGCSHGDVKVNYRYGADMINEWQHQRICYWVYHCNECNQDYRIVRDFLEKEDHSLTYEDMGHTYGSGAHSYRIKCTECSYSQVTSIPCDDGSSKHNTPW